MKKIQLFLLVLLAFGFTSPAPVKLAYNFKQGETYNVSQTLSQQIKQSIMGMDQNMDNNTSVDFALKVTEVNKGLAKIEFTYKKIKTNVKSPQVNTELDSEGSQDVKENKLFKGLVDKPFFVWINQIGKVEKVEGIDTLRSAFRDAGIDEGTVNAMKSTWENFMGEEGLKSMLQKTFITYPETQLKKGDTWKNVQTMAAPFSFTTEDTWTLAEQTENAINLTGHGLFSTDKEKVMDLPGGLKARVDLTGNQLMKSTLNPKSGVPSGMETASEVKGKMILLAGGPIPEDMEMPMEIISEVKTTITKR